MFLSEFKGIEKGKHLNGLSNFSFYYFHDYKAHYQNPSKNFIYAIKPSLGSSLEIFKYTNELIAS